MKTLQQFVLTASILCLCVPQAMAQASAYATQGNAGTAGRVTNLTNVQSIWTYGSPTNPDLTNKQNTSRGGVPGGNLNLPNTYNGSIAPTFGTAGLLNTFGQLLPGMPKILPPTNMDSFVSQAGGAADNIYGDEGTNDIPPLYTFQYNNRINAGIFGERDAGLTTGHGSWMPSAWGADEFLLPPGEWSQSGSTGQSGPLGFLAPLLTAGETLGQTGSLLGGAISGLGALGNQSGGLGNLLGGGGGGGLGGLLGGGGGGGGGGGILSGF